MEAHATGSGKPLQRRDPFSVSALYEAHASGAALISCPFIVVSAEFGIPGTHYLSVGQDAADIADRILRLLEDHSQRQALGRRARKWAEDGYRTKSSVDSYCDLYRELAAGGRACRKA